MWERTGKPNLLWSTFYFDLNASRAKAGNTSATGDANLVSTQGSIDPKRLPKSFAYNSTTDTMYFVLTDPVEKEANPILYEISYPDSVLTNTKLFNIDAGTDWNNFGNLAVDETKDSLFGLTGYDTKTVWKYSKYIELRIPVLKWGYKTCKNAIKNLVQLIGGYVFISPNRILTLFPRVNSGSVAKTFTKDEIIKIESIKDDPKHSYDGIKTSWSSESSESGEELKGIVQKGKKILSISNSFITNSSFARLISNYLFPIFIKNKKRIKFKIRFPVLVELNNLISFDLPSTLCKGVDLSKTFEIDKITISDKSMTGTIEATTKKD